MAYCTQDDILEQMDEDVLIQLTDDDDAGVVDEDKVTRAIADADEEIDAYLAVRYALPFGTTPNLVRKYSVDLAICNLYARRQGAPEARADRCERVRKDLDKISKGTMELDVPDPAQEDDAGPRVSTSRDDRVFTTGRDSDSSTGSLDNY